MATLILTLATKGIGLREAIAICQSHCEWALAYILQEEFYR